MPHRLAAVPTPPCDHPTELVAAYRDALMETVRLRADVERLTDELADAQQRAHELEQRTLEYAALATELREHSDRSERLAHRVQKLVA